MLYLSHLIVLLLSQNVISSPICGIKTSSGLIFGHPAPSEPKSIEYLGIPYAKAPRDHLRFAPPQPYKSNSAFNASSFSPACAQIPTKLGILPNLTSIAQRVTDAFVGHNLPQSEDCLALNVWVPPSHQCGDKKPVLIWLHGGRFQTGASSVGFYHGQYLATNADVIVVSINYRLGIFGYSGAPGISPNVGLLDQRLAFEWVRDNIEAFGGDADAITFAGQSAGAMSMDYYAHSPEWRADPIARAMIFESGQVSTLAPNAANLTSEAWTNVTKLVHCEDTEDPLTCMRKKPVQDLLEASAKVSYGLGIPAFQVTVDDILIFNETTYEAQDNIGDYLKLPSILGTNNYEPGFFRLEAAAKNVTSTNVTLWKEVQQVVSECPVHFAARTRANHSVPSWRYQYFGEWDNLRLYPGSGAWHGSETAMVFGTAADVSGVASSSEELAVTKAIMKAWGAFIHDPLHGLSQLGWPRYNPSQNTLVRLAYDNSDKASFDDPAKYDIGCEKIGYQAGLSF